MAKRKWKKTSYPGVRCREHKTRKHGVNFDRYFAIRYKLKGKTYESGVGWTSEGWTAKKVSMELAELKRNAKTGEGPLTLAEKREMAQAVKDETERMRKIEEKEALTFSLYFETTYHPAAAVSKKHNTWKQEGSYYRVWLKTNIGRIRLVDIRPLHIEKIKRVMLRKKKSPRTIQAVLALARQVWNHARNNDIVSGDWPGRSVKAPKFDNRKMRFFIHDECESLISKLRETSPQVADMALLSLDTGMRAGEIFSLTWEHVHIDAGQIQVMDTKGGRNRMAYMTKRVKSMLQGLQNDRGLVFPSKTGGIIGQISATVIRAIKDLGLNDGITDSRNKATFHSLRHTFASRLVANGTDLYTVKELMGHSTLAMTERYSHVANESLEAAVQRMERATAAAAESKGDVIPLHANQK